VAPPFDSGVIENATTAGHEKASALTVAQGVSLVLLAVAFGYAHAGVLPDVPTRRDKFAPELVDTLWRAYFLTTLGLCVVALILGIIALARPGAHPLYSVITGIAVILVGLVGCFLGFLSVGNGTDMGSPIVYFASGAFFAGGGAVITVLSAFVLGNNRRARRSVDYLASY
jgi:uncharacterized membrane protein